MTISRCDIEMQYEIKGIRHEGGQHPPAPPNMKYYIYELEIYTGNKSLIDII